MYNSEELIMDNDLTFLSFNQTINEEFTMSELLESDLWITDYAPIFVDKGVTGDKNTNWYTSNMLSTTDNEGTTVYNDNAYGAIYADDPSHTAYFDWEPPFTVELDVISFSNANLLIYDGIAQATKSFNTLGISGNNHLKVVNDGKVVKWFVDGVEKTGLMQDISQDDCQVALRTGSKGGYIKYKNFRIHRGNVVKAVPLFNCDRILSSNGSDVVLDINKCIILKNNSDTVVTVESDDTGSIHYYDSVLYAYAPYCQLNGLNELVVYCIVYDKYLNTLNNVEVSVYVDNELNTIIKTNNEGLCEFKVDTACTVKFKYEDTTSNEITIR